MRQPSLPLITLNAAASFNPGSWLSIVIACVRAIAAIEVAAAHLRALFYPGMRTIANPTLWYQGLAFFTGFGHQAVLMFFIISGWLVGGSMLDKWQQPHALAHYAVDRVTRLWTVLIPVFVLTLLLALSEGKLVGTGIDYSSNNEFSALTFAGNLAGLQLIIVPNFGGNFALWSLSNETWYYLLFPLLILMWRTPRQSVRTLCALALTLMALTLPPILLLYFSIWLLGAAASRVRINCGKITRAVLVVVTAIASIGFRLKGLTDDVSLAAFLPDLTLSLLFAALLCSLQQSAPPASPVVLRIGAGGRFLAEFSFTLYVIHVPLIHLFQSALNELYGLQALSPHNPLHLAAYLGMLGTMIAGAWLFYLLFEARTPQVRKWAKRKLLRRTPPVAVPA